MKNRTTREPETSSRYERGRWWRYVRYPRKLHIGATVQPIIPKMRYTLCGLYVLQFFTRSRGSRTPSARLCGKCRTIESNTHQEQENPR